MAGGQSRTSLNKPCILLIVIAGMERFAFKGVASNLVTYLTDVAKMSNSAAAKKVNNWCGITSMLPLLVAPLADSYLDRYTTVLASSSLYVAGLPFLHSLLIFFSPTILLLLLINQTNSSSETIFIDMDDEYAKLIRRMNPPRVVIDNDSCEDATIIQVDSVNKHGILLQVVQVLTDLNLVITKAYISSDGGWFMDVFNVTDQDGNKVRDEEIINYIQKTLENDEVLLPSLRGTVGLMPSEEHTSIELSGTDRPGLLSEVCAVLADLSCNVVNAAIWTHNARAAAVVHVVDNSTGCAIEDPKRLAIIKKLLHNVLKCNNDLKTAKMTLSPPGFTHRERRLHQIMFADRDYVKVRRTEQGKVEDLKSRPCINVYDCSEKDYTVITMRSRDRPKLLFDIVCTLTDMQYVVFHGVVHTGKKEAYQEFYIRHVDGLPISSEAERERVIQCLEAAIERRASVGLELELCAEDRLGLLSDITRIFRENSLCVKRAEISTEGGKAKDIFYVTDVTGNPVDQKTVDSICEQVGQNMLHVKWNPCHSTKLPEEGTISYLLGNLFKVSTLQNLKLMKYYT